MHRMVVLIIMSAVLMEKDTVEINFFRKSINIACPKGFYLMLSRFQMRWWFQEKNTEIAPVDKILYPCAENLQMMTSIMFLLLNN